MNLRPLSLKDANSYVEQFHRHHKRVQGHKFSLGCEENGQLVGVVIAGRPVARWLDDGLTLEVTRLCTDGTPNSCSFLYGAARRVAKEMGYWKILTYILSSESGLSLKASGWICADTYCGGGSWSSKDRPRLDKHPLELKQRWECQLNAVKTVARKEAKNFVSKDNSSSRE